MMIAIEFAGMRAERIDGHWSSDSPAFVHILDTLSSMADNQPHGGHPQPDLYLAQRVAKGLAVAKLIHVADPDQGQEPPDTGLAF